MKIWTQDTKEFNLPDPSGLHWGTTLTILSGSTPIDINLQYITSITKNLGIYNNNEEFLNDKPPLLLYNVYLPGGQRFIVNKETKDRILKYKKW